LNGSLKNRAKFYKYVAKNTCMDLAINYKFGLENKKNKKYLKLTKAYCSAICLFYGDYTELASRKSEQAK
jgi:hypothetical protein